jgi:hypothetical protein
VCGIISLAITTAITMKSRTGNQFDLIDAMLLKVNKGFGEIKARRV